MERPEFLAVSGGLSLDLGVVDRLLVQAENLERADEFLKAYSDFLQSYHGLLKSYQDLIKVYQEIRKAETENLKMKYLSIYLTPKAGGNVESVRSACDAFNYWAGGAGYAGVFADEVHFEQTKAKIYRKIKNYFKYCDPQIVERVEIVEEWQEIED